MLFDDPATLEPDKVVDWFDLCSAGLAREEQEAYKAGVGACGRPHAYGSGGGEN